MRRRLDRPSGPKRCRGFRRVDQRIAASTRPPAALYRWPYLSPAATKRPSRTGSGYAMSPIGSESRHLTLVGRLRSRRTRPGGTLGDDHTPVWAHRKRRFGRHVRNEPSRRLAPTPEGRPTGGGSCADAAPQGGARVRVGIRCGPSLSSDESGDRKSPVFAFDRPMLASRSPPHEIPPCISCPIWEATLPFATKNRPVRGQFDKAMSAHVQTPSIIHSPHCIVTPPHE